MQKILYKKYIELWKNKKIGHGFSYRLPDYASRYWFEKLEKTILSVPQKKFLDIGAGDGRLSWLLLKTFYGAGAAIEVEPPKRAWEKILYENKNVVLHHGLLQEKFDALKGEKFDLILLSEVFEHIPPQDISSFLQKLQQIMSDEGRIFLTTPNFVTQGSAEQSQLWHEKTPYGHYKHYSFDELSNLLEEYGFIVDQHAFECNKFKTHFYNKKFYKISRLDAKLLFSKKLPKIVRITYQLFSTPIIIIIKGYFWGLAQVVYFVESKWNKEQKTETLILSIRKK